MKRKISSNRNGRKKKRFNSSVIAPCSYLLKMRIKNPAAKHWDTTVYQLVPTRQDSKQLDK